VLPKEPATILTQALPYRSVLTLCGLLMLLESTIALAVPWLGGRLAGAFLQIRTGSDWGVTAALTTLLTLFGVQALLKFTNTYLLGSTAEKIVADLKIRVYDHLQALPLAYFQQRRQGDTLALLTHDVYVISGFVSGTALAIVPLLFTVASAVFFMFRLQPMLALFATLLIPLFYLSLKVFGRRLRPLANQLQEEYASAIAIAEENLGMLPAIKTFTREDAESKRHRDQISRICNLTSQQLRIHAALGPAVQFIAAAGIVLVLWIASGEVWGE
jgi:subfamily B ATP-binding cassette protein MsbA